MKIKVCIWGGMQSEANNWSFASRHVAALSYIEESFIQSIPCVSRLQSKPARKTKVLMDCLRLIERCRKSQQEWLFEDLLVPFSVVHGMKNPLYDMILEEKLARSPLLDYPVFFTLVDYCHV